MFHLSNYTFYPKRSTLSQQGFAPILLIALILIGITTATLLIQSRTNFLPQAQEANLDTIFEHANYTCTAAVQGKPTGYYFISNATGCDIKYTLINKSASNEGSECDLTWKRELMDSKCSPGQNAPAYWDCTEAVLYFGGSGVSYSRTGTKLSDCPTIQTASFSHLDGATRWCTWQPAQCPAQQPQGPAAQPAAAANSTEVPDVKCSDPNHPRCTTDSTKEYGLQKGACYMINSNLRCAYSKDYQSYDSANGPCNSTDNTACKNKGGCTLVKVTIKGQSEPIQYSICKNDTTSPPAPAGAAPRPAAGAPAAALPAAAPQQSSECSAIQDPWDINKRADSSKVKYVLDEAIAAANKAGQAKPLPEEAGNNAKQAYTRAFNEAYANKQKGFGVSITEAKKAGSKTCADNSATIVRDTEANNTAIHNYVFKKSPNINWETAKSNGLVQEAITNLKITGVTPSTISSPNGATSTPSKLTIDPGAAVDCGSDIDGTKIPCYKMGVFASYDDLKATEAQASIATQRYAKSQEILTAAKGKVSDAILEAAQTKLNAAKDKAAACMKK